MIYLRRQQHEAAGENREDFQKIPGFLQQRLPPPCFHIFKEIRAPDVIQGLKQDEQEIREPPGIAVVAHSSGIHQGIEHQRIHLIENQVGQVVKHRGQSQHQAEFPVLPVKKRLSPQQDSDTDCRTHDAIGKGIGNHPAHIPGLIGHLQNQDNRQRQRHQRHH